MDVNLLANHRKPEDNLLVLSALPNQIGAWRPSAFRSAQDQGARSTSRKAHTHHSHLESCSWYVPKEKFCERTNSSNLLSSATFENNPSEKTQIRLGTATTQLNACNYATQPLIEDNYYTDDCRVVSVARNPIPSDYQPANGEITYIDANTAELRKGVGNNYQINASQPPTMSTGQITTTVNSTDHFIFTEKVRGHCYYFTLWSVPLSNLNL